MATAQTLLTHIRPNGHLWLQSETCRLVQRAREIILAHLDAPAFRALANDDIGSKLISGELVIDQALACLHSGEFLTVHPSPLMLSMMQDMVAMAKGKMPDFVAAASFEELTASAELLESQGYKIVRSIWRF